VLIDHFTWRSVFFINVPVALLVLAASVKIEDRRESKETQRMDFAGAGLVTFGFGALVYGIIAGQSASWSDARVWVPAVASLIALAAFLPFERHTSDPLVPPQIFASRPFVALNAATFLLYGALGGLFFFFPFLLVQVYGYSVTTASFALLPFIAIISLLSRKAGALSAIYGNRRMIAIGTVCSAVGFALLGLLQHGSSYWTSFFPGALFLGFGMSMTVTPLTNGVIETATQEHVGMASGFNNSVSRVAGLLALAALGAVLAFTFNQRLNAAIDAAHLDAGARRAIDAQRDRFAGAQLADARSKRLVLASYGDGFTAVALCCSGLTLASTVIVLVGLRGRPAHQ